MATPNQDAKPFDVVVSFETIEHVDDPQRLLENLERNLAVDGVLIASVPVTPSIDGNSVHKSDFTRRGFEDWMSRHFPRQIDPRLISHPSTSRQSSGELNIEKYGYFNTLALDAL